MTFGDIRDEIVNRMGRSTTNDTALVARAQVAVLSAYRKALLYPWREFIQEVDITLTASTATYALPKHTQHIWAVWIPSYYTRVQAVRDVETIWPGMTNTTGLPGMYSFHGYRPYHTALSSTARELQFALQTGTTARTVVVTGRVPATVPDFDEVEGADTRYAQETVTVNNTDWSNATTATWTDIKAITASVVTSGVAISFRTKTDNTYLGTIGARESRARYPWIQLHPAPDIAYTLRVKVSQIPMEDSQQFYDNAVPIIPVEEYLLDYAWSQLLMEDRRESEGGKIRMEARQHLDRQFQMEESIAPEMQLMVPFTAGMDVGGY